MTTSHMLKCDCCGKSPVAKTSEGTLSLQKRSHGTIHGKSLGLSEIVDMLDPKGTMYRKVK